MSGRVEAPRLAAIVVHWGAPGALARLLSEWPETPGVELCVVDNDGSGASPDSATPSAGYVRWLRPGRNLGFGGGLELGVAEVAAPLVLFLNPDARPQGGALEALIDGFERDPGAAGLVPALIGSDGHSQHRWQLRPLPGVLDLLAQALFLDRPRGPDRPPPGGTAIGQPAACALALRRSALERVGGFDRAFYPAWFEDVDLARRIADAGLELRYEPAARFDHDLGSSVASLGYGRFLWVYYRNLWRYARKHHGRFWSGSVRALLPLTCLARIALLPLRRPRRAPDRGSAARGLAGLAVGALSGWRLPRSWASRFAETSSVDRDG